MFGLGGKKLLFCGCFKHFLLKSRHLSSGMPTRPTQEPAPQQQHILWLPCPLALSTLLLLLLSPSCSGRCLSRQLALDHSLAYLESGHLPPEHPHLESWYSWTGTQLVLGYSLMMTNPNNAKASSAELLELNLKNKLE